MDLEVNLKKLEKIVHLLEKENLDLEASLKLYEEGYELSKICEKALNDIKVKVQQISSDTLNVYKQQT